MALNPPTSAPKNPVKIMSIDTSSIGNNCTILDDIIEFVSTSIFHAVTNQSRPAPKNPLKKALKLLPGTMNETIAAHQIIDHQGINCAVKKQVNDITKSLIINFISSV